MSRPIWKANHNYPTLLEQNPTSWQQPYQPSNHKINVILKLRRSLFFLSPYFYYEENGTCDGPPCVLC